MFRRVTTALLLSALAVVSTFVAASPAQAFPRGACDSTVAPEGRPGQYFDAVSPINRSVWTHNMNGCQWLDSGKLKLRIDRTYPLADAAAAHRDLESRKTAGKLLLTVAP